LIGSAISYWKLQTEQLLGLGNYFAATFGIATLLLQLTIYRDLHKIEDSPDSARKDYLNWINVPGERWLRLGIMISLLFGVGKIADVVFPFLEYDIAPSELKDWFKEILRPRNKANLSQSIVVLGSLAVFTLLFIWNLLAWLRRRGINPDSIEDEARRVLVSWRIKIFIGLATFCVAYWYAVYVGSHFVPDLSEVLILMYALGVLSILLLRNQWCQPWLQARLVARYRRIRQLKDSTAPPTQAG
jgi:hypothetical protein